MHDKSLILLLFKIKRCVLSYDISLLSAIRMQKKVNAKINARK